jgi:protein-tyrosine phosphatase
MAISSEGHQLTKALENRDVKILFVCLGNICRSPTLEGVFRDLVKREAPQLRVSADSAGTADYHVGSPPDARSQRAAARRGIDLSGLRARQVSVQDFVEFDLILAMDRDNLRNLEAMKPPGARARVALVMSYADEAGRDDVPDPYYGGDAGFDEVLDLASLASRGLIAALEAARLERPSGEQGA